MCNAHVLLNKQFGPHNLGDEYIAKMLLALTTSYNGGAFVTTQGTHICLIISLILGGSRVAFISPNMVGHAPTVHKEGERPTYECKIV